MAKKIVKVEKKSNKKNSKLNTIEDIDTSLLIDLNKIKDVSIDNKDTIVKIVDLAGDLLNDDKSSKKTTKKASTKKSSSKKTTKKKSNDLDTVIDLASKFLK